LAKGFLKETAACPGFAQELRRTGKSNNCFFAKLLKDIFNKLIFEITT